MSKESTHTILGRVVYKPGVLFQAALKGPARRGKTKRDHASGAHANRIANRATRNPQQQRKK